MKPSAEICLGDPDKFLQMVEPKKRQEAEPLVVGHLERDKLLNIKL